jgi:hypothetical protein
MIAGDIIDSIGKAFKQRKHETNPDFNFLLLAFLLLQHILKTLLFITHFQTV